jgi:hypothetical protein
MSMLAAFAVVSLTLAAVDNVVVVMSVVALAPTLVVPTDADDDSDVGADVVDALAALADAVP